MHNSSAPKGSELKSSEPRSSELKSSALKSSSDHLLNDADRGKGSHEPDEPTQSSNNSMKDQLPHRAAHPLQDGADSDFPEPGPSPEHSFEGEHGNRELRKRKAS